MLWIKSRNQLWGTAFILKVCMHLSSFRIEDTDTRNGKERNTVSSSLLES